MESSTDTHYLTGKKCDDCKYQATVMQVCEKSTIFTRCAFHMLTMNYCLCNASAFSHNIESSIDHDGTVIDDLKAWRLKTIKTENYFIDPTCESSVCIYSEVISDNLFNTCLYVAQPNSYYCHQHTHCESEIGCIFTQRDMLGTKRCRGRRCIGSFYCKEHIEYADTLRDKCLTPSCPNVSRLFNQRCKICIAKESQNQLKWQLILGSKPRNIPTMLPQ